MALRDRRGARRGRAAGRGARFAALAVALFAAAAVLATWPAVRDVDSHFLAERSSNRATTPGDHLQTEWNLWLFGHQLERGGAPWRDPYSFQPEVSPRANFQGLVLGLPYWPLVALFGLVGAWNAFTLLMLAAGGLAACGWLRALDLPRGAALAGGLAFALAPYRVAQSTGHLLGPVSVFLPLSLWALERRRPFWAGAALAAIPLSGQVSLALGAVPLFFAYAFVRARGWRDALPGTVLAVAAAELVQLAVVRGSVHERGRSLAEVSRYSADWLGFLSRHGSGETFVFLGWIVPLLALGGLVVLARERLRLAVLLAAAVVVPVVLAVGTHLPTYRLARHVVPHLELARVPGRLLPIACLALAALAAFSLARLRAPALIAAIVLVAVDLSVHTELFHAASADQANAAYATLAKSPPGRLLELPVFLPDDQRNSAYLFYAQQAPRGRPLGYSTTAPRDADTTARRLRGLRCGIGWEDAPLARLGVRYVAVHRALFAPKECRTIAEGRLRAHGFAPLAAGSGVEIWTLQASASSS